MSGSTSSIGAAAVIMGGRVVGELEVFGAPSISSSVCMVSGFRFTPTELSEAEPCELSAGSMVTKRGKGVS